MADTIGTAIETNAVGPAKVSADGTSAEAQPIPDQIEADRYRASKAAKTQNHLGLRFRKLEPGGGGL